MQKKGTLNVYVGFVIKMPLHNEWILKCIRIMQICKTAHLLQFSSGECWRHFVPHVLPMFVVQIHQHIIGDSIISLQSLVCMKTN